MPYAALSGYRAGDLLHESSGNRVLQIGMGCQAQNAE
jgi:hypothetical protein